ncbi:MAG: ABC transporter permease subunit [Opitutaceae bacterium]|jgi:microcin C transport system permease protein|nr:ABC transporter permease subunit [Opitutaceae bacterium]
MFRLNPITLKKLRRFRSLRRGWWSFWLLTALVLFTFAAELFINHRALVVRHDGRWFFPAYGDVLPGDTFGLGYQWETDYRQLRERMRGDAVARERGDFTLLAAIPYNATENCYPGEFYRARPPDLEKRHLLGTDTQNRDIFARLVYGFRKALIFSFWVVAGTYALGIVIGCAMGYYRGAVDLVFQRVIEIWSNVPFLYVVIIIASLVRPSLGWLVVINIAFGWMGMTYYMRTGTLKEAARDYVASAQVLGASDARIIFRHILPNTAATLVTFVPFSVAGAIGSLTALDFLGFGLPVPTPSWGELLRQGTQNLTTAPWIVVSAVTAMTLVLTLVTFVGEAIREAFDPRKFTTYQ